MTIKTGFTSFVLPSSSPPLPSPPLPSPPPPLPSLQEKVKTLMEYVIENFMPTLEQVVYVDTFKKFKLRYEQDLERKENKPEAAV